MKKHTIFIFAIIILLLIVSCATSKDEVVSIVIEKTAIKSEDKPITEIVSSFVVNEPEVEEEPEQEQAELETVSEEEITPQQEEEVVFINDTYFEKPVSEEAMDETQIEELSEEHDIALTEQSEEITAEVVEVSQTAEDEEKADIVVSEIEEIEETEETEETGISESASVVVQVDEVRPQQLVSEPKTVEQIDTEQNSNPTAMQKVAVTIVIVIIVITILFVCYYFVIWKRKNKYY